MAGRDTVTTPRTGGDIDRDISARVRAARQAAELTQTDLARKIGTTFQQVQKYESGANRISAGRLFWIAAALDRPITDFFPTVGERQLALSR